MLKHKVQRVPESTQITTFELQDMIFDTERRIAKNENPESSSSETCFIDDKVSDGSFECSSDDFTEKPED